MHKAGFIYTNIRKGDSNMERKKIWPMVNDFWNDGYGNSRKLWHGGYSKLENPFSINQQPDETYSQAITRSQEAHNDIVEKNMSVGVEDCGFDKRLTEKLVDNGIFTLGDVHVMMETKRLWVYEIFTEKQTTQIGAVRHDSGVYGKIPRYAE